MTKNMAKANETGEVKLYQQPGDVAVMVRYRGKVTTFQRPSRWGRRWKTSRLRAISSMNRSSES
jgi:hypothetical protein